MKAAYWLAVAFFGALLALLTTFTLIQPHTSASTPRTMPQAAAERRAPPRTASSPAARPVVAAIRPSRSPSLRPVVAPPTPCAGNTRSQLVDVSLHLQRMWLCAGHTTVRQFPITSGRTDIADNATPVGHFVIQGRNRDSVLSPGGGSTYDVKYWIPFDAPNFGFHDASWQHSGYGNPAYYRSKGSHGCVHMPLAAIRFFYNWVEMGTRVVITRT